MTSSVTWSSIRARSGRAVSFGAPFAAPVAMIAAERLHLADAGEISILDVGGGSGIYSATWLAS